MNQEVEETLTEVQEGEIIDVPEVLPLWQLGTWFYSPLWSSPFL